MGEQTSKGPPLLVALCKRCDGEFYMLCPEMDVCDECFAKPNNPICPGSGGETCGPFCQKYKHIKYCFYHGWHQYEAERLREKYCKIN
jgi:hypothetical protein